LAGRETAEMTLPSRGRACISEESFLKCAVKKKTGK
jgi:hypothetical protein